MQVVRCPSSSVPTWGVWQRRSKTSLANLIRYTDSMETETIFESHDLILQFIDGRSISAVAAKAGLKTVELEQLLRQTFKRLLRSGKAPKMPLPTPRPPGKIGIHNPNKPWWAYARYTHPGNPRS